MVTVECPGMEPGVAETLGAALREMVAGLLGRDAALSALGSLRLCIADDFAGALADAGQVSAAAAIVQVVGRPGETLMLLDGRRLASVLAGAPEELARLLHLLHLELWRSLAVRDCPARPVAADGDFERHLLPLVEALWTEYLSTRRAVWSLPADADLMLPHLAELLDALPPATAGDVTLALAQGGDLDDLFGRAFGRVAHLVQVVAHVQGYLAGLGRPLESLSPELAARVQGSFLGARWFRIARLLEALYGSEGQWDGVFLRNTLQPEVTAVFGALGLDLRRAEDGGLWLEPRPAVRH